VLSACFQVLSVFIFYMSSHTSINGSHHIQHVAYFIFHNHSPKKKKGIKDDVLESRSFALPPCFCSCLLFAIGIVLLPMATIDTCWLCRILWQHKETTIIFITANARCPTTQVYSTRMGPKMIHIFPMHTKRRARRRPNPIRGGRFGSSRITICHSRFENYFIR